MNGYIYPLPSHLVGNVGLKVLAFHPKPFPPNKIFGFPPNSNVESPKGFIKDTIEHVLNGPTQVVPMLGIYVKPNIPYIIQV